MWEPYSHLIEHIDTGEGALKRAAAWISHKGWKNPVVVSDVNTRRAAGEEFCGLLNAAGVMHTELVYPDTELMADERALGILLAACGPSADVLIGVGSGTICDLCKFVAFQMKLPCVAVGTAPSMDGYSSAGAAITVNGAKTTPQTRCPAAIFCDTLILKDAPMPMIAAGTGDMLGKLNALADWKLSSLLTGEPMPEEVVGIVSGAVAHAIDCVDGAAKREPDAIRGLTDALILSGISVSVYGDTRPASGTEHHLSHFWEMRFMAEGKPPVLHGLKVGVATLIALGMWKSLPLTPEPPSHDERAPVIEEVKRAYGPAAAALLRTENPNLPFDEILEHWPDIRDIAASAPEPEYVAGMLSKLGAPLTPAEIGVDEDLLRHSILLARERKKTYTLLQLLGDLGKLGEYGG